MEICMKVNDVDSWKKYFPPVGGDKQWKDGYSALEFAKIVTGFYEDIDFEKKLQENLKQIGCFTLNKDFIFPEHLSKFDDDWHGPRHHDLSCIATKNDGSKIALCFEAKVYESFDITLEKYIEKSDGKRDRCSKLCNYFFGKDYAENYKDIYYQILSSIAGTIAFANENEVDEAIFIVYQIIPENNNKTKNPDIEIKNHKQAINDFLTAMNINKKIEKSGDLIDLGKLSIERKNKKTKVGMSSIVKIAYIEQNVSGKK